MGDSLSMMTFLVFFVGGSDRAAPKFGLVGHEVGDEPPFSNFGAATIFKLRCRLL